MVLSVNSDISSDKVCVAKFVGRKEADRVGS